MYQQSVITATLIWRIAIYPRRKGSGLLNSSQRRLALQEPSEDTSRLHCVGQTAHRGGLSACELSEKAPLYHQHDVFAKCIHTNSCKWIQTLLKSYLYFLFYSCYWKIIRVSYRLKTFLTEVSLFICRILYFFPFN